ncbi:MAG: molybdopterin-guanine dinucleotide biosynthesis protein B [Chloroflexi bacterium]|nr:molybdopterin-guanine dinucleotide biosynthesis protein B [Chloroflexota bacterium]
MIPLLSVVGKSGSGKTTLVEQLVRQLKARGIRVAVVKHHAHPTRIDRPGKDSARLTDAGADLVLLSSPIELVRFEPQPRELTLAEICSRIEGVDFVLTEGFKREPAPKLEISRAAVGAGLIASAEELIAVATDYPIDAGVPRFDLDDTAGIAEFIVRRFLPAF